jgi:hypothetical protein
MAVSLIFRIIPPKNKKDHTGFFSLRGLIIFYTLLGYVFAVSLPQGRRKCQGYDKVAELNSHTLSIRGREMSFTPKLFGLITDQFGNIEKEMASVKIKKLSRR